MSGDADARPLLAVDGDSLAHRAFHALPDSIVGADGQPANMLVGFANMLLRVWEAEEPRTVFVGFDSIGEPTYRHELLPQYQSGRDFPRALTDQLDRLPELVEALGFPSAKAAGYEADDFVAAAVRAEEDAGGTALVLTSDRDMFQLASEKTTILMPKRGVGELQRVGPDEVRERYGVRPEQVPDFVALRGDSADRIPGARGVGESRAAMILREHETLDGAIEAGVLQNQADQLRLYLRLTRLQYHAPVPEFPDAQPDWARAAELVQRWGLKQLAGRLRERAGDSGA
ncbi:MAG TPA: 5'-3' exonuclease [Gaiellaceae bacterium]|nr:5'-3' exonuclease [Gaiellaceae bacterium]